MKIGQIASTLLSALIKIAVAIWVVNFIYTKTIVMYDFGYRVFTEAPIAPAPGRDVTVSITEGKSKMDIAKMLEEKGLVRDHYLTFVQLFASEYKDNITPGAYTLNTSMTAEEMFAVMGHAEVSEEEKEE